MPREVGRGGPEPSEPEAVYDPGFVVVQQPAARANPILKEDARWNPTSGELYTSVLMSEHVDLCRYKVCSCSRRPRELLMCDIPKGMCHFNELMSALWAMFCLSRIRQSALHPNRTNKAYLSIDSMESVRVRNEAQNIIIQRGISLLPMPLCIVFGILMILTYLAHGAWYANMLISNIQIGNGMIFDGALGLAVSGVPFIVVLVLWIIALVRKKWQNNGRNSSTFGLDVAILWTSELSSYGLFLVAGVKLGLPQHDQFNVTDRLTVYWIDAGIIAVIALLKMISMAVYTARCVILASKNYFKVSNYWLIKCIFMLMVNYLATVVFIAAEILRVWSTESGKTAPRNLSNSSTTTTSKYNTYSDEDSSYEFNTWFVMRCAYQGLVPILWVILYLFSYAFDIQLLASLIVRHSQQELRENALYELVHMHPFLKRFYAIESPRFIITLIISCLIHGAVWSYLILIPLYGLNGPAPAQIFVLQTLYIGLVGLGIHRVILNYTPVLLVYSLISLVVIAISTVLSILIGIVAWFCTCVSNFCCCCCYEAPVDFAIGRNGCYKIDYIGSTVSTTTIVYKNLGGLERIERHETKHFREVDNPGRRVTHGCCCAVET